LLLFICGVLVHSGCCRKCTGTPEAQTERVSSPYSTRQARAHERPTLPNPSKNPTPFSLPLSSPSPPAAKMISQTPEWAKKTVGDVGIFRLHEVPHKRSPAYSFGPPEVLPDQVLRARSTTILYSLTRSLSILLFISSVPTFTRPHCHTSSSHARSHESRSTPTPLLRVPRYSGLSRHLVSLAGPIPKPVPPGGVKTG